MSFQSTLVILLSVSFAIAPAARAEEPGPSRRDVRVYSTAVGGTALVASGVLQITSARARNNLPKGPIVVVPHDAEGWHSREEAVRKAQRQFQPGDRVTMTVNPTFDQHLDNLATAKERELTQVKTLADNYQELAAKANAEAGFHFVEDDAATALAKQETAAAKMSAASVGLDDEVMSFMDDLGAAHDPVQSGKLVASNPQAEARMLEYAREAEQARAKATELMGEIEHLRDPDPGVKMMRTPAPLPPESKVTLVIEREKKGAAALAVHELERDGGRLIAMTWSPAAETLAKGVKRLERWATVTVVTGATGLLVAMGDYASEIIGRDSPRASNRQVKTLAAAPGAAQPANATFATSAGPAGR